MALVDICLLTLCLWLIQNCTDGSHLCQDFRVLNVMYPANRNDTNRIAKNLKIVRIVNRYKLLKLDDIESGNFKSIMRSFQRKDFGFIVKIMVKGRVRCSGALVAPRLVVTSGNCFTNPSNVSQLKVLISGGRTLAVAALRHSFPYSEISLITLKLPATGIKPIGVCVQPLKMGSYASMIMASQNLSYYGRRRSQLVANSVCKVSYMQDESAYITRNMLCLSNSLKPAKCATIKGDSLLINNRLCGINIYGSRCQLRTQNADLYANLNTMRKYIYDFVKKLHK